MMPGCATGQLGPARTRSGYVGAASIEAAIRSLEGENRPAKLIEKTTRREPIPVLRDYEDFVLYAR
jgi:hypothetical protein